MSKLRKLSIRGIRNFGHEEEEEGWIRFSRPVTLILGPNGTGKTTIIEALKYATTGELPPGSDQGKYFVHDPILTKTAAVQGKVQLEVDLENHLYTASRIIETTRRAKSFHFKTVDKTLTRMDKKTRKKESVGNRCIDIDTELSIVMGVSKSILSSVVFCHQEELNWPLEDGKKLKERFDDIFDSARFNKALENNRSHLKIMKQELLRLKMEKKSMSQVVDEVKSKENYLSSQKTRWADSKAKIQEIDRQHKPIKEEMLKLEEIDKTHRNLLRDEEKFELECDMIKQQYSRLECSIQNIFEGSTNQLEEKIASYDDTLSNKTAVISEHEGKLQNLTKDETRIGKLLGEQRTTVGTFKQQVEDQEKRIVLRHKTLNDTLKAWGLNAIDTDLSEFEITGHIKNFEEKLQEQYDKLEESRRTNEEKEKTMQHKVDLSRDSKTKIKSEIEMKENQIDKTQEEMSSVNDEITLIGVAAYELSTVDKNLVKANDSVEALKKSLNVSEAKRDIQEKTETRATIEIELNNVDDAIKHLHEQSALHSQLEHNKSILLEKGKELDDLKQKHEKSVCLLLNIDEMHKRKLKNDLDEVYNNLVDEIKSVNQTIRNDQCAITTLKTTLSHKEDELRRKKNDIQSDKKKISMICDYENFEDHLLWQSTKVKELQKQRGMYAYENDAYEGYLKKLKQKDPCCPLCDRDFAGSNDVDKLIKKMEEDMKNHPDRLNQVEAELQKTQKLYDEMLQLKPLVHKVMAFEQDELGEMNKKLESYKAKLIESEESIENLQLSISEPEHKLKKCKEILGEITLWDRCIDDSERINETIQDILNETTKGGKKNQMTMNQALKQRENLKNSLKETQDSIENIQSQVDHYSEKLQRAIDNRNVLYEKQLKIRSDVQKLKQLQDKRKELNQLEITLNESVNELKSKLINADDQLKISVSTLEKMKEEHRIKQEEKRKLTIQKNDYLSALKKVQDEIESFNKAGIIKNFNRVESQIKSNQKILDELHNKKQDLDEKISQLKEDINFQEVRKRELLDNLLLRKTKNDLEKLKKEISEMKSKIKGLRHKESVDRWNDLRNKEEDMIRRKNVLEGIIEELEASIQQNKRDLQKENYRLARTKYKEICIDLTVQEKIISDLLGFIQILDQAMIKYHEQRMNVVNKVMEKLWRKIYTGSDTFSIQIRADATGGMADTRRQFNYRLVQVKHGHEMDMRGRCSAGQKVLASIIIRLALAETFCKTCGILALDEPTTNLDEKNANSLAESLSGIIKFRAQHQKNFQLIVITHDEKFLLKLASLSNNQQFYELYRKPNGFTGVKLCHMNRTNLVPPIGDIDSSDNEEEKNVIEIQAPSSSTPATKRKKTGRSRCMSGDSGDDAPQKKRMYNLDI